MYPSYESVSWITPREEGQTEHSPNKYSTIDWITKKNTDII